MQEFQLRVIPTENNDFVLELYQCAYKKAGEKKRPAASKIGCLKGNTLNTIKQNIYDILKANNYYYSYYYYYLVSTVRPFRGCSPFDSLIRIKVKQHPTTSLSAAAGLI